MRFFTFLFCLSLGTLAYAETPAPFAVADVPISTPMVLKGTTFVKGTPIDLKQFRGKAVVVAMISTTCKHCQFAIEDLIRMQQQYGSQGLQIVGVAGDAQANSLIQPFIEHYHINFPFGYLQKDAFLTLAHLPSDGRPFVPILLFIDPKGMVRNRLFGNDAVMKNTEVALSDGIKSLLAQSAPLLKK